MQDYSEQISSMTLEEKAGMMSGLTFWLTKAVGHAGVKSIRVSDGPVGLRIQLSREETGGESKTLQSVCFPSSVGTTASFDRKLLRELGETLGEECRSQKVAVLLGPAVNIKRSPLCGRNFEYMSEDPYLTSVLATEYINGVQSKNIGVSLKHFAANNQESRRMLISAEIDERALREIYLAAFEGPVKKAKPWTLMCSYNKINGTYSSENPWLLTQVLREEWGFDGYVMSDWGAVCNRVSGIKAGLELEMPYFPGGQNDSKIIEAIKSGALSEETLDTAIERLLRVHDRYLLAETNQTEKGIEATEEQDRMKVSNETAAEQDDRGISNETATKQGGGNTPDGVCNPEEDHRKARRFAADSMVLLKNEGVLPLKPTQKIAVIGRMAETPRFQGGGSSHVNSYRVVGFIKALREAAKQNPELYPYLYAPAYDGADQALPETLLAEAKTAAAEAEVAVIFTGLPNSFESEGYDRKHLELPKSQNRLIDEICSVQKNVIVVLHNGSPVAMPWIGKVSGVLEAYLGGEAVGEAELDLLYGRVNPSAKLAETFPLVLKDCSASKYFPGKEQTVEYRESIYVGYRYYDTAKKEVLFPFGHGLSYTEFAYSDLQIDSGVWEEKRTLTVQCTVKNTGSCDGAEILQLYVSPERGRIFRAEQELKGFEKVFLHVGEEKTIRFLLKARSFAYYDTTVANWQVPEGEYEIRIGASSRDIRLKEKVLLSACGISVRGVFVAPVEEYEPPKLLSYEECRPEAVTDEEFEVLLGRKRSASKLDPKAEITIHNCLEDARHTKWGKRILTIIRKNTLDKCGSEESELAYYGTIQIPLHSLSGMSEGVVTPELTECLVNLLNDRAVLRSLVTLIKNLPAIRRVLGDS